jgi:putative hydrolase of the HAD superfamily
VYALHQLNEKGMPQLAVFFKHFNIYNDYCWERYRQNKMKKDYLRHQRFYMNMKHFGIRDRKLAKTLGQDYITISPYKTALVEGAREVLEYLHGKYELHIITNGFEEVQHVKLREAGIGHYFRNVITSERVGRRKPDPKIFEFALRTAKAYAAESLMIGDDYEVDIQGAENAGIRGIWFSADKDSRPEAERIGELLKIRELL